MWYKQIVRKFLYPTSTIKIWIEMWRANRFEQIYPITEMQILGLKLIWYSCQEFPYSFLSPIAMKKEECNTSLSSHSKLTIFFALTYIDTKCGTQKNLLLFSSYWFESALGRCTFKKWEIEFSKDFVSLFEDQNIDVLRKLS